jgi:hypothetical protein
MPEALMMLGGRLGGRLGDFYDVMGSFAAM